MRNTLCSWQRSSHSCLSIVERQSSMGSYTHCHGLCTRAQAVFCPISRICCVEYSGTLRQTLVRFPRSCMDRLSHVPYPEYLMLSCLLGSQISSNGVALAMHAVASGHQADGFCMLVSWGLYRNIHQKEGSGHHQALSKGLLVVFCTGKRHCGACVDIWSSGLQLHALDAVVARTCLFLETSNRPCSLGLGCTCCICKADAAPETVTPSG